MAVLDNIGAASSVIHNEGTDDDLLLEGDLMYTLRWDPQAGRWMRTDCHIEKIPSILNRCAHCALTGQRVNTPGWCRSGWKCHMIKEGNDEYIMTPVKIHDEEPAREKEIYDFLKIYPKELFIDYAETIARLRFMVGSTDFYPPDINLDSMDLVRDRIMSLYPFTPDEVKEIIDKYLP